MLASNHKAVTLTVTLASLLLCSAFHFAEAKAERHCRSIHVKKEHKVNGRAADLAKKITTSSKKHHHSTSSSKKHQSSTSTKKLHTASSSRKHATSSTVTTKSAPAKSSSSHSSVSTASSALPPGSTTINQVSFTPKHGKAGVAGAQSLKFDASALGWFYDWSPTPASSYNADLTPVPMLWGLGRLDHDDDIARFKAFQNVTIGSVPFVMGFNEPDFEGQGSSGVMNTSEAASAWDQYIGPHGRAGAMLISPSMAKQKDETWLAPFIAAVTTKPDIIAVHIFQDNMPGVQGVVEHFATYGKPMWITEFACINYQGPAPVYCDQNKTDTMIRSMVQLFQADKRIAAFSYSDAYNGPNSALTPDHNGRNLSATGETYLSAVQSVKSRLA